MDVYRVDTYHAGAYPVVRQLADLVKSVANQLVVIIHVKHAALVSFALHHYAHHQRVLRPAKVHHASDLALSDTRGSVGLAANLESNRIERRLHHVTIALKLVPSFDVAVYLTHVLAVASFRPFVCRVSVARLFHASVLKFA